MRRIPILFAVSVLLLLQGCQGEPGPAKEHSGQDSAVNAFSDSTRLKIAQLQHARDAQGLLAYTSNQFPSKIRVAAVMGFGSLQDTSARIGLEQLLNDPDLNVQSAAAFSLGQTGSPLSVPALLGVAKIATDTMLTVVAYEAIGKCGTAEDLKGLVAVQKDYGPAQLSQMGLMAALYRFGLRGIFLPETEELAMRVLERGFPKAAFWAGAFLGRVKDLGTVKDGPRLIRAFNKQSDPETRHHLVRRLGRCRAPECLQRLEAAIADTNEIWPVKVNAIRSLGEINPAQTPDAVFEAIEPLFQSMPGARAHVQVAMEASNYLKSFGKQADLERIKNVLELPACKQDRKYPTVQGNLMAAWVRLSMSNPTSAETARSYAQDVIAHSGSLYHQGYAYLALGQDPTNEMYIQKAVLPAKPVTSTYAMDALALVYAKSKSGLSVRVEFLNQVLASGDVALVAQAAGLIASEETGLSGAVKDTMPLFQSLNKLKMPRDVETATEIRKALDKVAGRKGSGGQGEKAGNDFPVDWDLAKKIPSECKWNIETDLGSVVLRLSVEEAPATVCNIVKLAREGYFNGKIFHRVVPNFVAQAGCPRGDGWGSCEPMLRSEFNGLRYARGAVGMASSGKDTESCQFFITHSATPHLDGRYTVFGYVESGISVVERLEVGNRIIKTTIDM